MRYKLITVWIIDTQCTECMCLYKSEEKWSVEIWNKPKLKTYCLINNTYDVENYVEQNITKTQRSLCAQLHFGTLPLPIETGRFRGEPEEQRLSLLCDLGQIEDEIHFKFHCPLYDEFRCVFFLKISVLNSSFFYLDDYEKLELSFKTGAFLSSQFYL